MKIALCTVSVLFGALSMLAAFVQAKNEKKPVPAVIMTAGSLLLLAAVICNTAGQQADFIVALIGCIAICAAAIMNGVKSGQLHIQHHIIRIALSVILVVGFALL